MGINQISEALQPNPALQPLSVLIGEWKTTGKHPMMPGIVLDSHTSFKWIEGGAFLIMYSSINHEQFPAGITIFGSDDMSEVFVMNYFDARKISRRYSSTLNGKVWKWWRDDPDFAQKFTGIISEDGNTIVAKGEMSKNGMAWEGDLELIYTRIIS